MAPRIPGTVAAEIRQLDAGAYQLTTPGGVYEVRLHPGTRRWAVHHGGEEVASYGPRTGGVIAALDHVLCPPQGDET